jgi:hypothetical protein
MTLKHRFRPALVFLALAGGALLFAIPVAAHAATTATNARQAAASGHVTIIVLDMSGSMAQNDPNGLRCSAANAYIDLSGPGDFVGVVGLDNSSGATGGPHNFDTAQKWADPTEMATEAARAGLRNAIAAKSHNCKPDANTPTYDALNQAQGMLKAATQGGKLSGSVILLTDGEPEPNPSDQTNSIQQDLAPQFKAHGWPVDTIALGTDTSFHSFLNTLSNGTSGKFYDDSKGPVAGVSPLNLEHFFVDIFQLRNGRTPGANIPPTTLSGGTTQRNFSVGNFDSHLDVIAVKDQSNTKVTITSPGGTTIPPEQPNTFVATDPHYVIFSLNNPQPGNWQLNVTGGGQFLMDSLVVSRLQLTITSPGNGKAEPLGQPVTISATLEDQGSAVVGGKFALKAVVSYAGNVGGNAPAAKEVLLSDTNASGNYTGTLTIPTDQAAGSYEIAVAAQSASETAVQAQITAQFVLFPTPVLFLPGTQQPATAKDTLTTHVVTWDAGLQFIYSSLPFFNGTIQPIFSSSLFGWHPSDWPLGGLAAKPGALIDGEVLVGANVYSNATVQGTATQDGTSATVPVTVQNDGNGYFRVFFPASAKGSYHLTLTAQGAYKDSYGALGTASSPIGVTVGTPSLIDELRAWAITLLYLAVLATFIVFFIYGPINYAARAKPHRGARLVDIAMNMRAQSRSQLDNGLPLIWHGWSLRRYFAPNVLPAGELSLPNNLSFVYRRGNEVAVRVRKPKGKEPPAQWSIDGRRISHGDGTETILSNMRIAATEGNQKTEWKFEQDAKGGTDLGMGSGNAFRDRVEEAAGNVGLRDRLRRGRGMRND